MALSRSLNRRGGQKKTRLTFAPHSAHTGPAATLTPGCDIYGQTAPAPSLAEGCDVYGIARPPKVWRRFEVGRDLSAMAARDLQLFQAGYQRTPESVAEVYGEGYERVETPQLATPNSAVSFSEPAPAEADRIANRLGDESSDLLSGLMAKVREAIDGATSLDEARARLESLSADMDASPDLIALVQQALVAAELRGRFEVADDLGLTRGA